MTRPSRHLTFFNRRKMSHRPLSGLCLYLERHNSEIGRTIAAISLPDLPSNDPSEIDELLWSPAPGDDEQKAPSKPHILVPRHTKSSMGGVPR